MESRGKGVHQRKMPHFFKVFLPGITSEFLEIPPAFRKHMKSDLRSCFLTCPSGNTWSVALQRGQTGALFFTDGWKHFAQDHAMEIAEFIVFIYHGAARFRLLIFDTSACEKQSAFRAIPSRAAINVERRMRREREGSCGVAITPLTSRPKNKWRLGRKSGCQEDPHAAEFMLPEAPCDGDALRGDTGRPAKTYSRKRRRGRGFLESQRRPVTSEEIERAHAAANAFTSENPFQVVILRKVGVYIGHCMHLPHSFARSHLPKTSQKIVLSSSSGNEWKVKYLPSHTCYIFSAGWRQFSLDNNLEQDDACVFEVIGKDKIRVHIFRVVEEVKPLMKRTVRY